MKRGCSVKNAISYPLTFQSQNP